MDPARPKSKPILLKDLKKLWASPSFKRFGPRNTLLLDDSPYKAAMNPEFCAIHPKEYKLEGERREEGDASGDDAFHDKKTKTDDDVLGPGGALREYLARLATEADFVDAFVEASPWRSCGEEAPASSDEVMRKAREGGRAVAAAEAAARVAGRDANEIDLPSEEEEEEQEGLGNDTAPEKNAAPVAGNMNADDDPDGWGGSGDEAEGIGDEAGVERLEGAAAETRKEKRETTEQTTPRKKPRRVFDGSGACLFLKRWAWKREAKSDEERFDLPYEHEMSVRTGSTVPMGFDADDGDSSTKTVSFAFEQARFDDKRNAGADGGFASTVWDSAIVLAKFIEKHQEKFRGLRVVELGAGCGLVSVALIHAGAARVVATDLPANTKLLRNNVSRNAPSGKDEGHAWDVKALSWGKDANEALGDEPFDLVIATDCMYVAESACLLADTLEALVGEKKKSRAPFGAPVLFAYGRNRQAESLFEQALRNAGRAVTFVGSDVPDEELDELYQCSDVRVVRYRAEASA
jgi:predicted nicotinamide N-methyase